MTVFPLRLLLALVPLAALGCAAVGDHLEAPAARLTIASYNIKHGLGMDGRLDLERVAAVLEALNADVVLLQEVDERCGRSGGVDQAVAIGERLGMDSRFAPFMDYDGGRYGLATLSRRSIVDSEVIELPPGTREPRSALSVTIEVGGEQIRIANAHLDWLSDDTQRLAQAQALRVALASRADGPMTVLGGDLNDVPGSPTLELLTISDGESEGEFDWLGPVGSTFPSDGPERTIDHFLAHGAGRWTVVEVRVVDEQVASDHRPIVAIWTRDVESAR